MILAALAAGFSFSDAMDSLGRPEGERLLGALLLTSFACVLIAFQSAGVVWVLTDISRQIELLRKPPAENLPAPIQIAS
ncbi:MAG: hypothetical protein WCA16_11020 [Candidatus Sulfotelmatobacter sp.]